MNRKLSIGGWCLMNTGTDPFGAPVRKYDLLMAMHAAKIAGISHISWHDADLWPDDASANQIDERIDEVLGFCSETGLVTLNFTSNTFSHPAFRAGALSNPSQTVRDAALGKALRAVDQANAFGAKNMIWWGGREGDDYAHASDAGDGLNLYLTGVLMCMAYGRRKGYRFGHSVEPKQYEPRLGELYPATAHRIIAWAEANRELLDGLSLEMRVNPEYPQHVQMLGMSAVIELEMLLKSDYLADFIHWGGQIPGRLDCDLPPYWGDNDLANSLSVFALERAAWDGVIELDCRPPRTTVTEGGWPTSSATALTTSVGASGSVKRWMTIQKSDSYAQTTSRDARTTSSSRPATATGMGSTLKSCACRAWDSRRPRPSTPTGLSDTWCAPKRSCAPPRRASTLYPSVIWQREEPQSLKH